MIYGNLRSLSNQSYIDINVQNHCMQSLEKYVNTVYRIIGAAMEVHGELKHGLLEPVYQEALSLELSMQGIDNEREQLVPVFYKGIQLDKFYKIDILVKNDIIVELKSAKEIIPEHRLQLFNYLKLTKKPLGLLINFGEPHLHSERYAFDEEANECFLVDKNLNG